jgi:hypothetical protein
LFIAALGLVVVASPPAAAGTALYAYAKGGASSPTTCPPTTTASDQCTLAEALSLATAGSTVTLATSGTAGHYVGNWAVATKGTSAATPIAIEPATDVSGPVLDGNQSSSAGCTTATCKGPILAIGSDVFVHLDGITFQDGRNVAFQGSAPRNGTGYGGAIENVNGGTVSVSACTFLNNVASDGGAIDNGDGSSGAGILGVVGSKFLGNVSPVNANSIDDGGAIDNADNGGTGTVTVSASTFTDNAVGYGAAAAVKAKVLSTGESLVDDGGAIDNADNGGKGTLKLVGSSFVGNTATPLPMGCVTADMCSMYSYGGGGGAIDNGDDGGHGTLAVSGSTFSGNSAHVGGAIANSGGTGSLSTSTFTADAAGYGGAVWDGNGSGSSAPGATLSVSASTFSGNTAAANGGAVDIYAGSVVVSASTFSANRALGNKNAPGVDAYNAPGVGGAIANTDAGPSTLALWASTLSANTAKAGGAVNNGDMGAKGVVAAAADILNGTCHQLAVGTWQDEGYNIGSDATCLKIGTGDVGHGAGLLAPLAHNGGPTETILALAANPAVGVVPLNTTVKLNGRSVTLCPTIDQRGVHSAVGKACNAGAVQSSAP